MNTIVVIGIICAQIFVGGASQYAPGVMDRVVELRQKWGQLPDDLSQYDGAVAVPECLNIGTDLWCRPVGSKTWEHFIAADCGSKSDSRESDGLSGWEWMVTHNMLIEVDYETAVRWDTVGKMIEVECTYRSPYHPKDVNIP